MTKRLKKIMSSVIAPNQCSFVPGHQITDNIIVYQEVLHFMRSQFPGKGFMIIKVDLEKAYDRLSWPFIRDTLANLGLREKWTNNIMYCIETPRMAINGMVNV